MPTNNRNASSSDWKRLWQLVSGIHYETPEKTVLDELTNVSKELQEGLLHFKPKNATNVTLETLLHQKNQDKLLEFTLHLQDLLDLESQQCWDTLCYYLTKEYRGSASFLTTLISTESNMMKLLHDIWDYYSLQRMIILKIVKNLLVFYNVPNHPYCKEYKQFVDKISLQKLRDSYLEQFNYLINASPPSKVAAAQFFNYNTILAIWSERNAREINEVSHILLLICEHLPVRVSTVTSLFHSIRQNCFGKKQTYLNSSNSNHKELMTCLSYSQVALLIKCLDFENVEESMSLINDIFEALEDEVSDSVHDAENGPLLFVWMLLDLRSCTDMEDEACQRRCKKLGKRALELNCFRFLYNIMKHPMFQDESLVSCIVRKTIYNQMNYMCDIFDGDGSCARYTYIYELLCELLSWPQISKEFTASEHGVHSLYNTLIETFPLNFTHMSMVAHALNKSGQGGYIKSQLMNLPILTELYDETKHKLRSVNSDEFVLVKSVKPFPSIDFTIPADTTVCVMTRPAGCCVHIRTSVNYFNVLQHEIYCLLKETTQVQSDFQTNERIKRVESGLNYLTDAIERIKCLSQISVEMVYPTEMSIDILQKFKNIKRPPIKLLANCLKVCTALLPLVDTEIVTRVHNLDILPNISNESLDFKKYANGVCFDARLVGSYIEDVEKQLQQYDFQLAYLRFLRTHAKLERNRHFQIEIPGMIFIFRNIFSYIQTWHFETAEHKNKIIYEILSFICETLDSVSGLNNNTGQIAAKKEKELLRDICVYSLLNLENGLILLRYVGLGNAYLQHKMELQTNWMSQQPHDLIILVRLSMRILMQLLCLRCNTFDADEVSPLESLIYTQPKQRDTLRIIPIVTSYMSNIFDRWLPILSCRLLKRIALQFNMSLLACLDMEPDQIRLTFLQKLPDEFESDSVKIAILELVEACIKTQPGVTEAFFKVDYGKENRSFFGKDCTPQIADSVLTFLTEFLNANENKPINFDHPLPCKVMNLFYSLWKQNLQMLVEKLIQKPKFWTNLSQPLFNELRPDVRVYTQLLNILSIEVYSNSVKTIPEVKEVVTKFFEKKYFEPWIMSTFNLPELPVTDISFVEELPEWICRLQAFKDFMIIVLRNRPKIIEIPNEQYKQLKKRCFQALLERADYVEDIRPFIVLSELYLFLLLNLPESYTENKDEEKEFIQNLQQLLCRISTFFEDLHIRGKEACLSIIIKSAQLHKELLVNDATVALRFLNSAINIIGIELKNLEYSVTKDLESDDYKDNDVRVSTNSLVLSLNLLKAMTTIFHQDGPVNWDLPFVSARLFRRLLSCTASIMQMYNKQKLTIEFLDVLIAFAKGNCSGEFLHCDVGEYIWLNLLPPKELVQSRYEFNKPNIDIWTAEKWWAIYARGIEFVTSLYERHGNLFLKDTLLFVGIHEVYLVDALQLGKQSLEPNAIYLIKCTANLISKLSADRKQWREEHAQSMYNIMRSVQSLMGHSVTMFHQPRKLRYLISGKHCELDENIESIDDLVTALNDLTEIIILCVRSLQKFSPSLINLICDPVLELYNWEPVLEVDFGAPKISETNVQLTLGVAISIVSIYVKSLTLQNHTFSEIPLNTLPKITSADGTRTSNTSITSTPQNTSSTRSQSQYSKSMSISISSALIPTNELFSNLDPQLCLIALENILTLVASQSMLALKNTVLTTREKQYIRREITGELLPFHDFVRRKVIGERENRIKFPRRKHGQVFFRDLESRASSGESLPTTSVSATSPDLQRRQSMDINKSMRVNVVRRLHLQQQQKQQQQSRPNSRQFEMSQMVSPITTDNRRSHRDNDKPCTSASVMASTPQLSRPSLRRESDDSLNPAAPSKRSIICADKNNDYDMETEEENYDSEIQMLAPEEVGGFDGISVVQFVEEDYLHILSNIFKSICHND